MSKHTLTYNADIYSAFVNVDFELDPEDFLGIENENDLIDKVYDIIYSEVNMGDVQVDLSENEIINLTEFIEEWKSLKGLK